MPKLLTVEEAAERLGLHPKTIRDWISQRRLAIVKFGRQRQASVRIEEQELERLVAENRRPAWTAPTRRRAIS
jgi:excisionase family DNA binding protein